MMCRIVKRAGPDLTTLKAPGVLEATGELDGGSGICVSPGGRSQSESRWLIRRSTFFDPLVSNVYPQRLSWRRKLGDAMFDIASFAADIPPVAIILSLLGLPVVYVAAFNTGPVGKTAREVLAMFLRRHPPR
jgi:hypothetical protein